MRRKSYFTKVVLLLFVSVILYNFSGVYAQESILALDKKKVIDLAVKASEDYHISENQIASVKSQYKEAISVLFPQVQAQMEWQNNAEFPAAVQLQDYEGIGAITVNQLIWSFGRVRSAIAIARQAILVTHYQKDATEQQVIFNAKQAYYTALLAEGSFEIAQESYDNVLLNKEILEQRSGKGRVSKRDYIKVSSDIAARIPTVNNARAQLKSALTTLKVVIDIAYEKSISLEEKFAQEYPSFEYDQVQKQVLASEPGLQSLQETINVRESVIKQNYAEYFPEISAFGSYSYKGEDKDAMIAEDVFEPYSVFGLRVDIPIFTGGRTSAQVARAKIEKNNAALEYKKAKEDTIRDLRNAMSDYREYKANLEANNNAVHLAEETFLLFQELFKSGQVSVTDLNDAELQLTNQKLARLQTLFNINVTLANIQRLTSEKDTEDE